MRGAVARATGRRPSLMHLTLGQAGNVLNYIGESPAKLNAGGRGVPQLEKAGTVAQWTMLGLLLLIVTASSPAGFVLAAAIVGLTFLLRKRRRDRQTWEDATWSVGVEESVRDLGDGVEWFADDASPHQDSSYAVPVESIAPVGRPAFSAKGIYPVSLGRAGWPNVEVVGENAYGKAIKAALRANGALSARRTEGDVEGVQVELVAEPDNPYDSNAISVRWRGRVLGYLSREDALRYKQPVRRIIASGLLATTTARIWGCDDGGQLRARVTVALPEPELIVPLNEAPGGVSTLLPWGSGIQVLKEENHFDILFSYVPPAGLGLLLVSLHKEIYTLKNGTPRAFVEVRLDGKRVGELSNVTSAHLLPLLEHTEAVGETAVAYARLTGSAVAAQLVLHAAKATEISNDWLSTGPHPARKLVPLAAQYQVPAAYAK